MFFLYPCTFCWQRRRRKDIYDPECLSETVLAVFETKLDMGRSKKKQLKLLRWGLAFGLVSYTHQSAIYKHKVDAFLYTKVCYFLFSM